MGGYRNVIVIEQENQGVSSARNHGLKYASGEYVVFIDSDDWCEPEMVEKMIDAIADSDLAYCTYYVDTDEKNKIINNAVEAGRYNIKDIYEPLFFGNKNTRNADMATALWRGMFKTDIINKFDVKFDTYIRFAEDWLFYADYFQYIKDVVIIDDALYHYYQRKSSVMHIFNPASMLGVQKSCYILDRFIKFAKNTEINTRIYEPRMAKRYLGLIMNQSKNVWNYQSPLKVNEKLKFLKSSIKEANIIITLKTFQYTNFSHVEKILIFAIEHNMIFFISIYGICYNLARDIRNKIKGK